MLPTDLEVGRKEARMAVSIMELLADVPDPREPQGRRHRLSDIITISILAVICGAEGWTEIEEFARAKEGWLREFLELPHGIPSHDTFGRVFALLDPVELESRFRRWTEAIAGELSGVVAIDGKTLRRSFDRAAKRAAIHMVSAWSAENGMVLGQLTTDAKSNEITAIPRLLKLLKLKGLIITIDAMGCQKQIARQIIEAQGDYMLQVKANQPGLLRDITEFFDWAIGRDFAGVSHSTFEQTEKGHGRVEVRRVWATSYLAQIGDANEWHGLATIAMCECSRTVVGQATTSERRYYISSVKDRAAPEIGRICRSHWGIENSAHWCLDMAFREDDSRVRVGNAAENLSRLRRITLNLLKAERTRKVGIKAKRLRAGWDPAYLLRVLGHG
jgi:predicted transposase YbfD/YdcC